MSSCSEPRPSCSEPRPSGSEPRPSGSEPRHICEVCGLSFFDFIQKFHKNNEECLNFFKDHNIIPSALTCPKCKSACIFRQDQALWRCHTSCKDKKHKRVKRCGFTVSNYKGTFLGKSKLQPWQILLFSACWLRKTFKHTDTCENLEMNSEACVDWRSYCSEVTLHWFSQQRPIGGDNIIVEIDETLICKRKHNTGRILNQLWLFGGIERESKKHFIVPLQDLEDQSVPRNRESLFPIIQKYIKPGSVIVSDCWKAYDTLDTLQYEHWRINHSLHFIDPEDPLIHTQNIERLWRDLKEYIRRPGIRSKYLKQYVSRYLFIKNTPPPHLRLHQF